MVSGVSGPPCRQRHRMKSSLIGSTTRLSTRPFMRPPRSARAPNGTMLVPGPRGVNPAADRSEGKEREAEGGTFFGSRFLISWSPMGDLLNLVKVLVGKRFPFQLIYSNEYWMVESGRHVFPLQKYRLVYENLLAMGAKKENFLRPRPAPDDDVLLVHTPRFLKHARTGGLSHAELKALEIRYSPELVRFALLSVGGTILAARKALESGLAIHIGGGFHHAFPDHGEGFCLFNDVAVAARKAVR